MIETIIFDIGGVLLGAGHRDKIKKDPAFRENERLAWKEFKVGRCSEFEYWQKVVQGTGCEDQAERMMLETRTLFQNPNKGPAYETAFKVKAAGYDLAIISDHVAIWARPALAALGLDKLFEPIVISEEVRMKKPDREIFEYTLGLVKRPAERCLFIDDMDVNLKTARELGMYTILCKEKEQVEKELKELNVLISF
ncbi:HAD-IA family hydrolase [Candidatus Woesearchaeota archaeon]|nr:HAD-IA family hydrolase [Candidatus Woesearchaeota archaeon]